MGNDLHIFSNGNIGAKRTNCSTKLCTAKFVSKPYTSKRPPIGKLFHLKNCVKKNVHVPFFARNACLPYRKNGFKAHFFRFAHFFRYGLFYLKLVALPRALQSKRLGTTHFFCGGALLVLLCGWMDEWDMIFIPFFFIHQSFYTNMSFRAKC